MRFAESPMVDEMDIDEMSDYVIDESTPASSDAVNNNPANIAAGRDTRTSVSSLRTRFNIILPRRPRAPNINIVMPPRSAGHLATLTNDLSELIKTTAAVARENSSSKAVVRQPMTTRRSGFAAAASNYWNGSISNSSTATSSIRSVGSTTKRRLLDSAPSMSSIRSVSPSRSISAPSPVIIALPPSKRSRSGISQQQAVVMSNNRGSATNEIVETPFVPVIANTSGHALSFIGAACKVTVIPPPVLPAASISASARPRENFGGPAFKSKIIQPPAMPIPTTSGVRAASDSSLAIVESIGGPRMDKTTAQNRDSTELSEHRNLLRISAELPQNFGALAATVAPAAAASPVQNVVQLPFSKRRRCMARTRQASQPVNNEHDCFNSVRNIVLKLRLDAHRPATLSPHKSTLEISHCDPGPDHDLVDDDEDGPSYCEEPMLLLPVHAIQSGSDTEEDDEVNVLRENAVTMQLLQSTDLAVAYQTATFDTLRNVCQLAFAKPALYKEIDHKNSGFRASATAAKVQALFAEAEAASACKLQRSLGQLHCAVVTNVYKPLLNYQGAGQGFCTYILELSDPSLFTSDIAEAFDLTARDAADVQPLLPMVSLLYVSDTQNDPDAVHDDEKANYPFELFDVIIFYNVEPQIRHTDNTTIRLFGRDVARHDVSSWQWARFRRAPWEAARRIAVLGADDDEISTQTDFPVMQPAQTSPCFAADLILDDEEYGEFRLCVVELLFQWFTSNFMRACLRATPVLLLPGDGGAIIDNNAAEVDILRRPAMPALDDDEHARLAAESLCEQARLFENGEFEAAEIVARGTSSAPLHAIPSSSSLLRINNHNNEPVEDSLGLGDDAAAVAFRFEVPIEPKKTSNYRRTLQNYAASSSGGSFYSARSHVEPPSQPAVEAGPSRPPLSSQMSSRGSVYYDVYTSQRVAMPSGNDAVGAARVVAVNTVDRDKKRKLETISPRRSIRNNQERTKSRRHSADLSVPVVSQQLQRHLSADQRNEGDNSSVYYDAEP